MGFSSLVASEMTELKYTSAGGQAGWSGQPVLVGCPGHGAGPAGTHRHVDSSEGRQSGVLGWEGLPARGTRVSPTSSGPLPQFPCMLHGTGAGHAHRADRMAWVSWPEQMSCVM